MRLNMLRALLTAWVFGLLSQAVVAVPLEVDWITQYGNETLQTATLSPAPRMLRNISNSLMTAAPNYLDGSIYLQRRTDYVDNYRELAGIGETAQDWLRPNRVTISESAVVLVAVRDADYPGAGSLLTSLGWTSLGDTITMGYYSGAVQLSLYAGLVDAGPVQISGAGVNDLRFAGLDTESPANYFFFQSYNAFSAETLADLRNVSVPEPATLSLASLAFLLLVCEARRQRRSV
ncbi:MAG TPA: hypothetical protein VGG64_10855 [Pirellulales bacterium]|jgi:hypothetical protein